MCGRFALSTEPKTIFEHFALTQHAVLIPRYNIAPSQVIPTIRTPGQLEFLVWGLRPKWLKEGQNSFINARMETITEKPAFKYAFNKQRCLIVADGYYEWKQIGNIKQPYYISLPQQGLFAFAGIWDNDTCAILTTPATQSALVSVHERMPVILTADQYATWLNAKSKVEQLQNCMLGTQLPILQIFPVSSKVSNPKNDFYECIKPLQ